MIRAIRWIIQRVGARALLILVLLILSMSSIAGMIGGRVRALESSLLISVSVAGIVFTWALARSRLREWLALPLIGVFGVVVIVSQVGNFSMHASQLINALYRLDNTLRTNWWRSADELNALYSALNNLTIDFNTLAARGIDWVRAIIQQKALFDPVAAALVWSGVFWIVAAWAAWGMRRRAQALVAMLPSLALLLAICAYTGVDNVAILVWPFFTLLILMAFVGHTAREAEWASRGIDYSEDIRFDMALVVTPIAATLVAISWFAPAISLEQIAGAVQQAMTTPAQQVQPVSDSLGLAPRPAPTAVLAQLRSPGLPRSHLLGSGQELSRKQVMTMRTGDLPPESAYRVLATTTPPRYYWRSTIYDHYIGSGWATSNILLSEYPAGAIAITYTLSSQKNVRQYAQVTGDTGGLIFAAGALVAADRNFSIAWRSNGDAFSAPLKAFADSYAADSTVSTASAAELRTVGLDYPDWIIQRYLQLPEDTPQRIYSLARSLTATAPTPYDRATVIEAYLRTYSYTLDLPVPARGKDVADSFLFELKRGYCDYFATSMVVLARAAGIPARLVVGYATGAYDPYNARYVITEADAHSWPEIYFGEYGWVEFEPTSGLAAITRPGEKKQSGDSQRTFEPLTPHLDWTDYLSQMFFVVGLTLVVLAIPGSFVVDWWVVNRMSPGHAIRRLFERLQLHTLAATLDQVRGDTPREYADKLIQRTSRISLEGTIPLISVDIEHDIEYLCEIYMRTVYGRYEPNALDRAIAWKRWQRTTIHLWELWIIQIFQRACSVFRRPGSSSLAAR